VDNKLTLALSNVTCSLSWPNRFKHPPISQYRLIYTFLPTSYLAKHPQLLVPIKSVFLPKLVSLFQLVPGIITRMTFQHTLLLIYRHYKLYTCLANPGPRAIDFLSLDKPQYKPSCANHTVPLLSLVAKRCLQCIGLSLTKLHFNSLSSM